MSISPTCSLAASPAPADRIRTQAGFDDGGLAGEDQRLFAPPFGEEQGGLELLRHHLRNARSPAPAVERPAAAGALCVS